MTFYLRFFFSSLCLVDSNNINFYCLLHFIYFFNIFKQLYFNNNVKYVQYFLILLLFFFEQFNFIIIKYIFWKYYFITMKLILLFCFVLYRREDESKLINFAGMQIEQIVQVEMCNKGRKKNSDEVVQGAECWRWLFIEFLLCTFVFILNSLGDSALLQFFMFLFFTARFFKKFYIFIWMCLCVCSLYISLRDLFIFWLLIFNLEFCKSWYFCFCNLFFVFNF